MNYDSDLKSIAENLFNSELVKTKVVSAENIKAFQTLLNSSIPTDAYGKNIKQFINFMYHHDKTAYYGFIEKSDLRHYLLLTTGLAIAGYLGVKNIVKIELTGDRYLVEPMSTLMSTLMSTPMSTPLPVVDERPRRKRGGRGRNPNNRDGRDGRDGGRDEAADRQRVSHGTRVMILGVNTEVARKSRPSGKNIQGEIPMQRHDTAYHGKSDNRGNRGGTYADKLKARYGGPVVVIPPIPAEKYVTVETVETVSKSTNPPTTKNTKGTALDQLAELAWSDTDDQI